MQAAAAVESGSPPTILEDAPLLGGTRSARSGDSASERHSLGLVRTVA
jgi:hypothetical protein